jgi:hypothetical protein
MSFSYNDSLDAWKPAPSDGDAKIRILELHPATMVSSSPITDSLARDPLRASLAWIPLDTSAPRKHIHTNSNVPNANELYPRYKALSYTWGTNKETQEMYVNGRKLTITLSLALALLHLRQETKTLKVWIDQICINQDDKAEKTEQVGLMDRIYRNTEEALVWLGPAADMSDAIFDIFNTLGAFAEHFNMLRYFTRENYHELHAIEQQVCPNDPKTIEYHAFCDSVMQNFTHAFFASLITFYKRPWFTRAWVVQEFSLPPKVTFVCGHKTIRAETLMVVLQIISLTMVPKIAERSPEDCGMTTVLKTFKEMNTLQPFFSSRQRRKAWDEGRINGDSLYHLLYRVCVEQSVQATRGCDMVYGLLGLANNTKELKIKPDYSEDNDNVQTALTYTHTAKAIITSGKVDLLICAQHMKKDLTLPSWVPDWRCKIRRSFAWLRIEEAEPLFCASGGQALELIHNDDQRVLALKGYKVDVIEEVGGPWTGGSRLGGVDGSYFPLEEYITYLAQVRQMCLLSAAKGSNIYPTSERRDEAIWRIPVGDIDQDGDALPFRAKQACKLRYDHCVATLELEMQVDGLTSLKDYEILLAEVDAMGKRYPGPLHTGGDAGSLYRIRMQELKGKRPFLSRVGYVGMGPSYVYPGDEIVVLTGASVPFVVRPIGESKYRFLGECYCDGIMDGEAVSDERKETILLI